MQRCEPGQREPDLGLLGAFAGELDCLAVRRFRDRPAVGGGLVAGYQVQHEGKCADRGACPRARECLVEEPAPGVGFAEEDRSLNEPWQELEILAQLGCLLRKSNGLPQFGGTGGSVAAKDLGHPERRGRQEAALG